MLVNLALYGLGYSRQYGDRVTNIRGRGCLYEGDSLQNRYPRWGQGGVLIRGVCSIKYLLSRGGGGGGALSRKCGNIGCFFVLRNF